MISITNDEKSNHGDASPWVQRWAHLVAQNGTVLDLACGHGRHMRLFAQLGASVVGVDRSPQSISAVARFGEAVLADVERGPWPFLENGQPRQFDAVVVTNYLWRPLFSVISQSLNDGGVLIYETFAIGNETVGKPSQPNFLLNRGELMTAFPELRLIAFEDGFLNDPPRFVQRLVAVREQTESWRNRSAIRYTL
jgi:SAM-dependent methyltransferase